MLIFQVGKWVPHWREAKKGHTSTRNEIKWKIEKEKENKMKYEEKKEPNMNVRKKKKKNEKRRRMAKSNSTQNVNRIEYNIIYIIAVTVAGSQLYNIGSSTHNYIRTTSAVIIIMTWIHHI